MDRLESAKRSIQDEHLDMLIRLAYWREEERLCQQQCKEGKDAVLLTAERNALTYAMFLEKMEAAQKEKVRTARIQRIRRQIPRFVNIAACLIIILCIAAPIAVAKVEYIRVQVMKLLIDIQADHTRLSLVEDEDAEFYVPEGWKGEYYPSYIPDGFQVMEVVEKHNLVVFKNLTGQYMYFVEMKEQSDIGIDSEEALLSYVSINGKEALLAKKQDSNIIAWSDMDTYFLLATDLSSDECIKIASGVQKSR